MRRADEISDGRISDGRIPARRTLRRGAHQGEARISQRGSARLFTIMVIAALLLFPVMTWVIASRDQPRTDDHSAALTRFLTRGPSQGLWETQRLYDRRRAYFVDLPQAPDRILLAPAPTPEKSICRTCRNPCSYTRAQVTQFFFEAPAALFAKHYVRSGGVEIARLDDGRPAAVVSWVPRRANGSPDGDSLTGRDVWFDLETGDVLQIEDHSRNGQPIRRVWRVSADVGDWDPASFDPKDCPVCAQPCPTTRGTAAEQIARVQERAPYTIVRPMSLPAGFELVRAVYREVEIEVDGSDDADSVIPARVTTLLYSDGLALISIAMAPAGEMDALEARFARMEGDAPDGSTCPTLSAAEISKVASSDGGGIVRWRSDACRTVARRDGVAGLSVTLLGRNEVDGDQYLAVITSVAPHRTGK